MIHLAAATSSGAVALCGAPLLDGHSLTADAESCDCLDCRVHLDLQTSTSNSRPWRSAGPEIEAAYQERERIFSEAEDAFTAWRSAVRACRQLELTLLESVLAGQPVPNNLVARLSEAKHLSIVTMERAKIAERASAKADGRLGDLAKEAGRKRREGASQPSTERS